MMMLEDDDVKGEEDNEKDDVGKHAQSKHTWTFDNKPIYGQIYRQNAADQMEHPDQAPASILLT